MMLENARLRVEIAALGAELMSVYDKKNDTELLWNGDPAYWKRRAPILFPNVGKTFGNTMLINGKNYATVQHGFARDSVFTCEESDALHAVYLLESSAGTLEKYPFPFELRIAYTLGENELRVAWSVKNTGNLPMFFTIGGHPAFCFESAEDSKDAYALEFPGKDSLRYILLDPAAGAANPDDSYSLALENSRLPLSDDLFANDALIFDGGQIEEVWLIGKDGKRRSGMICKGFPNYGIWSVKGAPFVCLEPWMGRADDRGFDSDISEKENINRLEPGCTFEKEHFIVLP